MDLRSRSWPSGLFLGIIGERWDTPLADVIPVILFAYSRPEHLSRTLECLRTDKVPLIHAFSDGPKTPDAASRVAQVRQILRSIDWCELVIHENRENLGLGRAIRSGVSQVLKDYDAILVFEDDLVCVPGTYRYLSEALRHYADTLEVMSVTGWTHPRATPANVGNQPYFDGRAECWVWGTWARAWDGMEKDAMTLVRECQAKGIDIYRYGADLIGMAEVELKHNIWAVRWLYLHILRGGLCLRPPHSLVEHIGLDELATNPGDGSAWLNPPLRPCPPLPHRWPVPEENPECSRLWRSAYGAKPPNRLLKKARSVASKLKRKLLSQANSP
jgi:hypothetical protein